MRNFYVIKWYGKHWLSGEDTGGFIYNDGSREIKEFYTEEVAQTFLTEECETFNTTYMYTVVKMFKRK